MAVIREELQVVDRFTAEMTRFTELGERMAKKAEDVEKRLGKMGLAGTKAGDQVAKGAQRGEQSMTSFLNTVKRAAIALGGFQAIKSMLNLSDELTLIEGKLRLITGSAEEAARAQDMIFAAAQRSRGEYTDMLQMVTKLRIQTGNVFGDLRETTAFVELLNKQFKIAGTDAMGIKSTMYNLTQALAEGVLRGQDLRYIFSNAPQLVQRIADYMGVTIGEIRKIAETGSISAEVVKNAILSSGRDINAQFETLPVTFGQAMTRLKNDAIRGFAPLRKVIADSIGSQEFRIVTDAIGKGLALSALIASGAFKLLGNGIQFANKNAKILVPQIAAVAAVVLTYKGYVLATAAAEKISAAATGVMTVAKGMYTAAVAAATAGQSAFNAALAACPVMWIVAAIALVIAAIVGSIMYAHEAAATGHTVCGDIAGVVLGLWSVILNGLATVGNFFLSVAEGIVNQWNGACYTIAKAVYDFASGAIDCFNGISNGAAEAASNLANCFVDGANEAIRGINGIIRAMNNIPGMSIGEVSEIGKVSLSGPKISKDLLTAPTRAATVSFERFETTSVGAAFDAGYAKGAAWGDNLQNSVVNGFNGLIGGLNEFTGGDDFSDLLDAQYDPNLGGGKQDVGSVDRVKKVEDVKLSDEDLKIYRDLAERRYMNNIELQTLAPNISVSIPAGQAQNLTAQDVADRIKVMLIEQAAAHTAVSHA